MWNYVDPTLGNCLFGAVELVKNADIDKYKYSGHGIGFDVKGTFSFPTGGFGKNYVIFGVDMNSSAHVDNKKKDTLIIGEGTTEGLVDTTLTAEKKYSITLTVTRKKLSFEICLGLRKETKTFIFDEFSLLFFAEASSDHNK